MKTIKVLDLFSGIGGFSHALDKLEYGGEKVFETVAFCEIDKDARRVLKKHWPEVPIFEDVSILSAEGLESHLECLPDMIVGGFPCTDISTAGLQKGLVDEKGERTRSGLWFEYKRLIREIHPKWVIIENVRNLVKNGLLQVLKDLDEVGYDCEWNIISARDAGACHLRERIWIVAWPR
jgi:DNA (cytosine-5)-methyltransferase 1